ncbi:MAG: DUF4386 family protein [Chloroflexia bacterium]|nr:DUF4386 family protein [Chloroflexia bacterium]
MRQGIGYHRVERKLNGDCSVTQLLPHWLSAWGLLSLLLLLIGAFSGMFGLIEAFSPPQMLLMLPIMLQEMVLTVWLIVKGYAKTEVAV